MVANAAMSVCPFSITFTSPQFPSGRSFGMGVEINVPLWEQAGEFAPIFCWIVFLLDFLVNSGAELLSACRTKSQRNAIDAT